jgi:hypothetical protein
MDMRQVVAEAEAERGEVFDVIGVAFDNACQTLIDDGRRDDRFDAAGVATDEVIRLTIDGVREYLSFNQVSAFTIEFFAVRGVEA